MVISRIVPFAIGATVGAAVVYAFASLRPSGDAPSVTDAAQSFATAATEALNGDLRSSTMTSAERPGVTDGIEQADDVEGIVARIYNLVTAAPSILEAIEIDALLARLVELDPTLASLAAMDDRRTAGIVAIRLLDVLGDDEASIETILGALQGVNALTFKVDALAHAAESDPYAALERAMAARDPVLRSLAVPAVAKAWALRDPQTALANSMAVREPGLRNVFVSAVLRQWAEIDAAGTLRYLGTADRGTLARANDALEVLAFSDPERTIEVGRRLSRRYDFEYILTRAARALAERDPAAAVARLEALPPGQEHRAMRAGIVAGYVNRDPVGALGWVQGLNAPSPGLVTDVMTAIRRLDIEQAFDLAADAIATGNTAGYGSLEWMTRNDAADSATMARIGERIALLDSEAAGLLLPRFAEAWSVADPKAALDWALDHGAIGVEMLPNIALNYRSPGLEETLEVAARLQPEYQTRWIESAFFAGAGELISEDPDQLLGLLSRYEGTESYDAILRAAASSIAVSAQLYADGGARELVEDLPEGELKRAVREVMRERQ